LKLYKYFDVILSVVLTVFFAGYLNFNSELIGLEINPISLPKWLENIWDLFGWMVFSLLVFDIYLKYIKVGNLNLFIRKKWSDLLLLVLWPIFSGLKILKIAVKLVKSLKLAKTGYKVINMLKKMMKKK